MKCILIVLTSIFVYASPNSSSFSATLIWPWDGALFVDLLSSGGFRFLDIGMVIISRTILIFYLDSLVLCVSNLRKEVSPILSRSRNHHLNEPTFETFRTKIGCLWLDDQMSSRIERFKNYLCTQGCNQRLGVSCFDSRTIKFSKLGNSINNKTASITNRNLVVILDSSSSSNGSRTCLVLTLDR